MGRFSVGEAEGTEPASGKDCGQGGEVRQTFMHGTSSIVPASRSTSSFTSSPLCLSKGGSSTPVFHRIAVTRIRSPRPCLAAYLRAVRCF